MGAPKGNKFALGNKGGKGPPPKYHSNYAKIAALAYKSGHIDQEVAELLGISVVTLHKWNLKHHEFGEARKTGKAPANERVIVSLYHRALGFSRNGKYFPPDVTACICSRIVCLRNGAIAVRSITRSFKTTAPQRRFSPSLSAIWPKWAWIRWCGMTAALRCRV